MYGNMNKAMICQFFLINYTWLDAPSLVLIWFGNFAIFSKNLSAHAQRRVLTAIYLVVA